MGSNSDWAHVWSHFHWHQHGSDHYHFGPYSVGVPRGPMREYNGDVDKDHGAVWVIVLTTQTERNCHFQMCRLLLFHVLKTERLRNDAADVFCFSVAEEKVQRELDGAMQWKSLSWFCSWWPLYSKTVSEKIKKTTVWPPTLQGPQQQEWNKQKKPLTCLQPRGSDGPQGGRRPRLGLFFSKCLRWALYQLEAWYQSERSRKPVHGNIKTKKWKRTRTWNDAGWYELPESDSTVTAARGVNTWDSRNPTKPNQVFFCCILFLFLPQPADLVSVGRVQCFSSSSSSSGLDMFQMAFKH